MVVGQNITRPVPSFLLRDTKPALLVRHLDNYLAHSAFWTVGVCRYLETRSLGNCERKDVSYKENVNDNGRENICMLKGNMTTWELY
jgi:hypothetical protein